MIKSYPILKKIVPIFFLLFSIIAFSQTFTDNTPGGTETFTVPAGVTQITIEARGAGGGGGGSTVNFIRGGGGGAGGAYASSTISVIPGQIISYNVGSRAIGIAGTGANGGGSWVVNITTVFAQGGAGGQEPNGGVSLGGIGSITSSFGTTLFPGISGGDGSATTGAAGGAGANSGGAGGLGWPPSTDSNNGNNGTAPGGGGGGAFVNTGASQNGGSGGNGQVIITWRTINTGTISPTSYCAGASVSIPYTITGTYNAGNVFTAQLSDAAGNFSTPVNIGTLTSTAASTISGTIPIGTATGNGYRVRVISSIPAVTGSTSISVLTVNALPTIATTTPNSRCGTGTVVLAATASAGTINWYAAATGGSTLGTGTSFTTPSISTTTSYYVDATNGSCTGTRTVVVATVNPLPSASGLITGTATVCQSQNNVSYSVPAIANATSYTWAYSGTGATISGTTNSILINFAANATSGNLTVRGTNACGNGTVSANYAINVNPLPATAGAITGTVTQFPALTGQIYSIAAVLNATTYNWTVPTGWLITAGAGTTSITVTTGNVDDNGNITVSAENACGTSALSTLAVTVIASKIDFDGTDDYVDFGDNHDFSSSFSLEAWVLEEVRGATSTIISKRDALSTNKRGYHLSLNNGYPNLTWYDNSGNEIINITAPNAIPTNIWHHIAATYDGTTAKLYADGILEASGTTAIPPTNGTEKFLIGAMYDSSTPTVSKNNFNGNIDEVRIWDVALTIQQLHKMMNQEIEQNATAVKGKVMTLDISGGLLWTNLKGYYPMNDDTANDKSGNIVKINGSPKNITTSQPQTAPLPYKSILAGNWDTPATWENNNVQYLPYSIINGTIIDWNIVETNHNINTTRDIAVFGLLNKSNELSINASSSLEVLNYLLINGVIDLDEESQLIQSTGSIFDNASTGHIERDQQGTGNKYRYNYWSMPVYTANDGNNYTTIAASLRNGTVPSAPGLITYNNSGYDGATSPFTLSTYWMYKYANSGSGYSAWNQIRSTGKAYTGQGFTMKGPGAPGSPEQNYVFVGKPNNGTIELTVAKDYDYLVGNPYPSAIDADQFINDNSPSGTASITGAIYFWEHYGGDTHNLAGYQGGYASYSLGGGVPASAFPGLGGGISVKGAPGPYIPVAQAFFVVGDAVDGGQIQFNNGQRKFVKESPVNSIFLKNSDKKSKTANIQGDDQRPKFRIGFDAPKISHRQLLLTIDEKATQAVDWGYEAEIYEVFADDMYWMLNNKKYVIQATNNVGLNSEVPLGMQLSKTGIVTVKIDALENVDDDTSIYLKDKLTGESFNMKDKPVQLNLVAGKYADRFVLVFKTQKLLAEDVKAEILIPAAAQTIIEGIHVYMSNAIGELQIKNNTTEEILSVALINSLGQTVKTWNSNFNIRTISLPLSTATGVYLVQINTKTGKIIKKISVE